MLRLYRRLPFDRCVFEPLSAFHRPYADWERQTFTSFVATLGRGLYNMDEVRHSIERMEPNHYLSCPYYEKWLTGMETPLTEKGVLTEREIAERVETFETGEATVPERRDPDLVGEIHVDGEVDPAPCLTRFVFPNAHATV